MNVNTNRLAGYRTWDGHDPFEDHAGPFYFRKTEDGDVACAFEATEKHCNGGGFLHGGLLMTMMDLCLAQTARNDPAIDYVFTVSMTSEFADSGRAGELVEARGEAVRHGRSLAFVRGQVTAGPRVLLNASAVFKLRWRRPA